MVILLTICALVIAGCTAKSMTNDQVIAETKKCHDNGMEAKLLTNNWTYSRLEVQCWPKEKQ